MIGAMPGEYRINAVERSRLPPLWSLLRRWVRNVATRRALRDAPDVVLRDLGMTRSDALEEAARPFWDDAPRQSRSGV